MHQKYKILFTCVETRLIRVNSDKQTERFRQKLNYYYFIIYFFIFFFLGLLPIFITWIQDAIGTNLAYYIFSPPKRTPPYEYSHMDVFNLRHGSDRRVSHGSIVLFGLQVLMVPADYLYIPFFNEFPFTKAADVKGKGK